MGTRTWTADDTAKAQAIWAAYQTEHDVSRLRGQTVGIDPESGIVWFGESALDVVRKMNAEGVDALLLFLRVGCDYYVRKGGRR
jgi:hypothetical protein